ncbi:glycoside hydrolase family 38 protein [Babjeviella inositovora NRRL Y-12698]|uniref:Alpha-mannosidase n=1 Tax=Babjeviella inositovora NRRL Y-12698 TaxID=984486 RepID=A0A1E3QSE2_9ASCO|nr:glycoside hydrolase family 38 protein [Babjeviella inositovora NRRL Y-12698]ODQ80623.1 glycoside hydrolase family 38 protein [Babjeviella inositovora NRRL Y-12698]
MTSQNDSGYAIYNNTPNFHPVNSIYENRLRQFIDKHGQYKDFNVPKFYDQERIWNTAGDDTSAGFVNLGVYAVPHLDRPLFRDVVPHAEFTPASKGQSFGPSWKTFWFQVAICIPSKWIEAQPEEIHFEWDCGNEGLAYSEDGTTLKAFTGGERIELALPKHLWVKEQTHTFYIEVACNGMFGNGRNGSDIAPPDENRWFRLATADLVLPNLEARRLGVDFWILSDAARELPSDSWQKHKARTVCNQIMNAFNPEDVASVATCREIAQEMLGKDINSDAVYHNHLKNSPQAVEVVGIGNCHIDTAWLWPFDETKRKVVRSWTTQLAIMEKYPEYIFVASQAQQFKWLKQYHPETFDRVKQKYREQQFFPIGGSWVEHDTNIPNGESLVRQFLVGQRFFLENFGFQSDCFWLPDTFGYSSQIPQLCRLANIDKFLTQKLSWNNINNFPNTTFNWIALDGSQVLVHMPPANTYTADANFGDVMRSLHNHKNLENDHQGMLLYGKGDGGGGPSEEMLEKLRRCRGLSNTVGLVPTVQVGATVDDFFASVLERTNNGKDLVGWNGELYFEFHRGTYTSQADIKKFMRLGEVKLHDLEYVASFASLRGYTYPRKELEALWEDLLLCQFHDVLPGSSIEDVYKDAKPMLRNVIDRCDELLKKALTHIGGGKGAKPAIEDVTFVNTLPWARSEVVESSPEKALVYVASDESGSVSTAQADSIKYPATVSRTSGSTFVLDNQRLRATLSNGILVSLYDQLNDRELIDTQTGTEGKDFVSADLVGGNQFVVFEDTPLSWQAWDTELFSLMKYKPLAYPTTFEIYDSGPLRSSVKASYKISEHSSMDVVISLDGLQSLEGDLSFLRFHCDVDWHEECKFLKVQFPTTLRTSLEASYETQYGITHRPTHWNTSWDVAKFEVINHKFADLSEFNYGCSVVNNGKYGFSIHGNVMRLSLLRAPKQPDAHADMGRHVFEYGIYPHRGALGMDTVKLGYNFNYRMDETLMLSGPRITEAAGLLNSISLESRDQSLILSHVKRAEDDADVTTHDLPLQYEGHKSLILRVYEALGGSSRGILNISGLNVAKIVKTNLLEEDLEEVTVESTKDGATAKISLRGFEVATYRVVLK